MVENKKMLLDAIKNSDILPLKQKNTLSVVCSSEYPISAKSIEKKLSMNKQSINYSLKSLLKRNFLIREKLHQNLFYRNKFGTKAIHRNLFK